MNAIISVIIPMYNSKDTIINSIKSVCTQSYEGSMEILVINDGSTDGSKDIVETYIKNNNIAFPIRLINKKNGGVSSARNLGIKESKGEWIALLDSDDIWLPEKISKQVAEIEKNKKIKFIGTKKDSDTYPFFKKNTQLFYHLTAKEVIMKWHPHTSTALINKKALINAGLYDETRSHAEDGDLWLRIAEHCALYVLNENLVYTGNGKRSFGDAGLSANMPKMYQGEVLALKSAKQRHQISLIEFCFFYAWISFKYLRRKIIVSKAARQ